MSGRIRYTDLGPTELRRRLDQVPVAVVPWGALEWHGPHLPFGLDGLVAEGFCERLAGRTEAVLLPSFYLPITALPHQYSISIRTETVRLVWRDLFDELGRAGFQVICLVSGHYAQGHEWVLAEAAEQATVDGTALVLAGTPLSLLEDPELLDHAGRWETAQLLQFRPDLVDLEALDPNALGDAHRSAVLGDDPRAASREEGAKIVERGLEEWIRWTEKLLRTNDSSPLTQLYQRRRASYQSYVDRYFDGSWEEAIQSWWEQAGG